MAEGARENSLPLEHTPTWVIAAVCSVIVFMSILVERILHRLGKYLKRKDQKTLFEALLKIKEELMLLGFISLFLTVFKGAISNICIPKKLTQHMLPCKREKFAQIIHSQSFLSRIFNGRRRILDEIPQESYCSEKGKVPLLSIEALDQLHIFIFVLAVVHIGSCVFTMLLGSAKIHRWKHWEKSIEEEVNDTDQGITHVHQHPFIKDHFQGIGRHSELLSWIHSFSKQFFSSVSKSDYLTMRYGFIATHCGGNMKFDFHSYMLRALEADFKKVVGIRWYLWIFAIIFMLLNVDGWHTYFWMAFIPLLLLLVVGAKLEHIIIQLAHEVAEKHTTVEGGLVVKPSDDHFWFKHPKIILYLIHFILFQNAFEIAFFFWILTTYGFDSCIMGKTRFIIPRIIIGGIIQLLCSYSTLPLYAIVTQMGSSFKKAIFKENVQASLVDWALKVKKRNKGSRPSRANSYDGSSHTLASCGSAVGAGDSSTHRGSSRDYL